MSQLREVTQFSRLTFVARREEIQALANNLDDAMSLPSIQTAAMVAFERRLRDDAWVKTNVWSKAGAIYNIKTVRVLQDSSSEGSEYQFEFVTVRKPALVQLEVQTDVTRILMADQEFMASFAKELEIQNKELAAQRKAKKEADLAARAAQRKRTEMSKQQRARMSRDRQIAREVEAARLRGDLQVTVVNPKKRSA